MDNLIETKKGFNTKKLLMFGIPIALGLSLVIAAAIYFATINVTTTVSEALSTTTVNLNFSGVVGNCILRTFDVNNLADNPLPMQLMWVETSNPNGVTYTIDMPQTIELESGLNTINVTFCYAKDSTLGEVIGNVLLSRGSGDITAIMHFTQKDLTTWVPIEDGVTADVTYSVTGESFSATGVPEGYTLVYYPNIGTYNTYTGLVYSVVGSNTNLPMLNDLNGGASSDYCTNRFNPDAKVCHGAKLWLVNASDLTENPDGTFTITNWNTAAPNILFETDLVTYTHTA